MSLRWDLGAIEDYETRCFYEASEDCPTEGVSKGDRVMNPVTNVLIWASVGVGLPGITRENVGEFYARLRFIERLDGALLIRAEVDGKRPEGSAAWVTPEEVIAHIGLSVNVSRETRTAWLKRFSNDLDRYATTIERDLAESEAAV